jgi:hypothetical protein
MKSSSLASLLVIFFFGSALALDFSYYNNISVTPTTYGWQYRRVDLTAWSSSFWLGASYSSLEAEVKNGSSSASQDLIVGAISVNLGSNPFGFISYFQSAATWNISKTTPSEFVNATAVALSGGYVGSIYLSIEEVNPAGVVVASQNLRDALFPSPQAGLFWNVSGGNSTDANLKYVTFTGVPPAGFGNFSVAIDYVASTVVGVLNQANAVIGPKVFESFFSIRNWPYHARTNSLVLVIGVGTGNFTLSTSGRSIISVNASSQVYFSLSNLVSADGLTKSAEIAYTPSTPASITNQDFYSQLKSKYGKSATYTVATITFPPGATNIIYDPALGAGLSMEDVQPQSHSYACKREAALVFVGILAALAVCW